MSSHSNQSRRDSSSRTPARSADSRRGSQLPRNHRITESSLEDDSSDDAIVAVAASAQSTQGPDDDVSPPQVEGINGSATIAKQKKKRTHGHLDADEVAGTSVTAEPKPKRTKKGEEESPAPDEPSVPKRVKITHNKGKAKATSKATEEEEADKEHVQAHFDMTFYERLGVMNTIPLSEREKDSRYLEYEPMEDKKAYGVGQSSEQQTLECFFRGIKSKAKNRDIISGSRIEYVKQYTARKEKLREWSHLSLPMRLNLIEGLKEVAKYNTSDKTKTLRTQAKRHLRTMRNAQVVLKDPLSWEHLDHIKDATRWTGDDSDDDEDHDEDVEDGNKSKHARPSDTKKLKPPKPTDTKTTKLKNSGKKGPNLDPEPEEWTDEQNDFFQEMLDDEKRDIPLADGERLDSASLMYKKLEWDFLTKFIAAKNRAGDVKWGSDTDAMHHTSRAHRNWFEKYELPVKEGKDAIKPRRSAQGLYRKLSKPENRHIFGDAYVAAHAGKDTESSPAKTKTKTKKKNTGTEVEDAEGDVTMATGEQLEGGGKEGSEVQSTESREASDGEDDEHGGLDDNDDEDSDEDGSGVNAAGHPMSSRKAPAESKPVGQEEEESEDDSEDSDDEGASTINYKRNPSPVRKRY